MENDFTRQADEVEALESIYPKEWKVEHKTTRSYSIRLLFVTLYITLPLNYPSQAPPTYQLSGPELNRKEKREIAMLLDNIYLDNLGEPVLYMWIEGVRDYLNNRDGQLSSDEGEVNSGSCESDDAAPVSPLVHGKTISDRKSTFQGHAARVTSIEEVKAVVAELRKNKKIEGAKHNVWAFRISKNKTVMQDYDDDGESQAGKRLLHLLQMMDVDGVVVIVTRWYGGIHLGPDRYRHYNSAGRDVLQLI